MRPIWITALAFAGLILTNPVPALEENRRADAKLVAERQFEQQELILTSLFHHIQLQASLIKAALSLYPEPPQVAKRKYLVGVVGRHFDRMTESIKHANKLLSDKGMRDEVLATEAAAGCDGECVTAQMSAVVVATGTAAKDSVLKLGLNDLGKFIHPAFGALAAAVLTLNGIVGGALTVISALVNGLFIAIAAGIAYLGKLVSDYEREQAGGPMGPKTLEINHIVERLIQRLGGSPEM